MNVLEHFKNGAVWWTVASVRELDQDLSDNIMLARGDLTKSVEFPSKNRNRTLIAQHKLDKYKARTTIAFPVQL